MGRKVKKSGKLTMGRNVIKFDVNVFGGDGHMDYSGYGIHGKAPRAHRRDRKIEEKNARLGGYED